MSNEIVKGKKLNTFSKFFPFEILIDSATLGQTKKQSEKVRRENRSLAKLLTSLDK